MKWSLEDISAVDGRIAVITGGTSGIGLATAEGLAATGMRVVLAGPQAEEGQRAIEMIKKTHPKARVLFEQLDLGSFTSISSFCDHIMQDYGVVDVLINNADVKGMPQRQKTHEGHEKIFGVNYLGHFALTLELFPLLLRSYDPRVVMVSSLENRNAHIDLFDLELKSRYSASRAYARSKLMLLIFALELDRRCRQNGVRVKSIPVHPGMAQSFFPKSMIQMGALPIIFAATSVEARSGVFYGPDGFKELWGQPTEVPIGVRAVNLHLGQKLWEASEEYYQKLFNIEVVKSMSFH